MPRAAPIELPVLYRDDDCVVINKPAGLLVHRSDIARDVKEFAVQILRNQLGCRVYPIHRLDRPTSGVLLFGLNPDASRSLNEAFQSEETTKDYLAVVRGWTDEAGVIDHPLVEPHGYARSEGKKKPAQQAVTAYRRLDTAEVPHAVGRYPTARYSLLRVTPKTGRRHQIRRHMKHIFHHLIGDTSYGDGRHNQFFRDELGCGRMLLAAVHLAFTHNGKGISVDAPVGAEFGAILDHLGWTEAVPAAWRCGVDA